MNFYIGSQQKSLIRRPLNRDLKEAGGREQKQVQRP